jgi:hypothetical protein
LIDWAKVGLAVFAEHGRALSTSRAQGGLRPLTASLLASICH